ncbi:glycosyl hydrolase family 28-related protein [Rathayibacter agropyri]|uniref:glycosyl hydrolase family 28-related protein n=1 Tax=Rathayibacter agropyri TaxID=1634927 RepID=UPI001565EDCA|nr:glycosyl hydrolase family 28-related protein [Rathayibacter agropyri]NRD08075.1 hypothetical protein [Rathayibacter agropyri]
MTDGAATTAADGRRSLAPNELVDPEFESGEITWTPNRQGAAAIVDDAAPEGSGSRALRVVASGGQSAASSMQLIDVTPGELWFGEIWIRATEVSGVAKDASVNMSVSYYSGSRDLRAYSAFVSIDPGQVSDAWRAFHGVFTVPRAEERPSRATVMRVSVGVKGVSSGSFLFDDMVARRVPWGGLSLRDFGAIGDGVTDDIRAVQAALDLSARQHMSITAPSGRYAVRSLLATERSSLIGIGAETLRFPTNCCREMTFTATEARTLSPLLVLPRRWLPFRAVESPSRT